MAVFKRQPGPPIDQKQLAIVDYRRRLGDERTFAATVAKEHHLTVPAVLELLDRTLA